MRSIAGEAAPSVHPYLEPFLRGLLCLNEDGMAAPFRTRQWRRGGRLSGPLSE